ncbi:MAG: ASCH domain-containing protein [Syntrophobacteraceae bacterium]
MKAITIPHPYAFEILSGRKTIEATEWDSLHRGDILICSARKPAFSNEEMEEIEDEYGTLFLYGHALCIARLLDVRPMRDGDEEMALMDEIDPDAYSWVFEDIRPVVPFPAKGKREFFEVDDSLITVSPFRFNEPVAVKEGTAAREFGVDFSGWRGRATDIYNDEGEPRIRVAWDSLSLKMIPLPILERCEREGIDWTGALLRFSQIESSKSRDTFDDVQEAIEEIIEDNPSIFEA